MPLDDNPELARVAAVLQAGLVTSWREAVAAIADRWRELKDGRALNQRTMQQAVVDVLRDWPQITAAQYGRLIDRLFMGGFVEGAVDAGFGRVNWGPDRGDQNVMAWLKDNPHGFVPALKNLGEDARLGIEKTIADAYAGHDELGAAAPFDLDDMVERIVGAVPVGEARAELIVRTETAKATALGRIYAWENDPERDWYWYHWVATPDDRVKDVSLFFEAEGPYDFAGIKRRWTVDHNHPQWVRNRKTGRLEWQTSAYNCRCTVARTPKEPIELRNEGRITQQEYERVAE